jgi:CheY-like chemotaxis protein
MPPPEAKAARLSQTETAVTSPRADLVPARGRVLLADDDLHVLRAYGRALSSAGHTVQLATNGREAIELIRSNTYDVIVSDISMPGMDGVQLLRNVRDRDFDVPVILMTASPAVDTAVKAVEYGALRYLIKPLDLTIFQNTVGDAIRLHQLAKLKREALSYLGRPEWELADRAGLETSFERALASIWMAYQHHAASGSHPRRRRAAEQVGRSRESHSSQRGGQPEPIAGLGQHFRQSALPRLAGWGPVLAQRPAFGVCPAGGFGNHRTGNAG